ncbi:hypothetical protein ACFE04_007548 [Oxalis oulophora]
MDSKAVKVSSSENSNPNVSRSSPAASKSPLVKSGKSAKKLVNPTVAICSPRNRIRERKFVVAKKKKNTKKEDSEVAIIPAVDCKCKEKFGGGNDVVKKCLCVAYETLRASQEEFFKCKNDESDQLLDRGEIEDEEEALFNSAAEDARDDELRKLGCSVIKRRRDRLMEAARNSVPECGKVMHLVKAFEKMLTIPNPKDSDGNHNEETAEEETDKWPLPGMQDTITSFSPSDLCLTSENLGLNPPSISSSWDSQRSVSSRTSNGGRRNRRNSTDSCGTMESRRWKKKKQVKVTSQKPFNLRTEKRGKAKEEEFVKKVEEMMIEEEKLRIPIAQGLPWTTDEPENLVKVPVKDNTRPIDLKLHTDMRAVERAEFDSQVAEKWTLIEQYKMERELQQKMAEEEEIRRLRKELVPKAQPMPYFDRPFIPRRSSRHPTIPREPKFHIPQHYKKLCTSWSDTASETCN